MSSIGKMIFGKGPGHWRGGHRKPSWRTTEVHEAFCSFGRKNRTHRLSDEEFYVQALEEVAYLFGRSARGFGKTVRDIGKLFKALCG